MVTYLQQINEYGRILLRHFLHRLLKDHCHLFAYDATLMPQKGTGISLGVGVCTVGLYFIAPGRVDFSISDRVLPQI